MDGWLYGAYTLAHAGLLVTLLRLFWRAPTFGAAALLLIGFGLLYDNAILALGSAIGAGPTLEALSWPRFWMHALFTPLLCLYGLELLQRAAVPWASLLRVRLVFWLLTGGLIGLGFFVDYAPLQLAPQTVNGVVRYLATVKHGPPIPAIGADVVLIVVGIVLWRRAGWRWLALGAAAMFIGSGAAGGLQSLVLGSAFEVVLLLTLVATERWIQALRLPASESAQALPAAAAS